MITNYLSRPRPIFLRVTGRPPRALSLRNFSNSLRSTCTQYGPALSHNCSLFYLHITETVLHIHSEPVLSDSVISTPVVGNCVAGCLMVRFYVFSSKCSKLYVLFTCARVYVWYKTATKNGWPFVTWLNQVGIFVSFSTLNSEQDMWVYSSNIWKRTYCRP